MPPYLVDPSCFIVRFQLSYSQTNFSDVCLQSASLYANDSQFQYICSAIYTFPILRPLTVSVLSPTDSQFSSLPPICNPAPHSMFLSFEDLFQPPPTTLASFSSPHPYPSITYFYFLVPLYLMFSLLSLKVQFFAPHSSLPPFCMHLREMLFGTQDIHAVCS